MVRFLIGVPLLAVCIVGIVWALWTVDDLLYRWFYDDWSD